MTTRGFWIALGLWCVLSAALAGCYDHGPRTEDGQSHWLRECTSARACEDGELCACGVCTKPCASSAACGGESSACVELGDDGPRCDDARTSVGKVCLASCERDDDCG